jgi:hypothetical protein
MSFRSNKFDLGLQSSDSTLGYIGKFVVGEGTRLKMIKKIFKRSCKRETNMPQVRKLTEQGNICNLSNSKLSNSFILN